MPCPETSTLTKFKIGGQINDLCAGAVSATVVLRLIAPTGANGSPIIDPTNNAILSTGTWTQTFTDGCWCTCEIAPNTAADPAQALTPTGSTYRLQVTVAGVAVIDETLFLSLEALQAITQVDMGGDCGLVIPVTDLLQAPATTPPTDPFCEAVAACVTAEVGGATITTNADGTVTITAIDTAGATTSATLQPDEVVSVTAAQVGTAAPTGAQVGVDPATGALFYVDGAGNWAASPAGAISSVVDGANQFTHSDGNGNAVTVQQASVVNNVDGTSTVTDSEGVAVTVQPDEVLAVTAAQVGTAAPTGAQWGVDPATGQQFYVDAAGNWATVLHPVRESALDVDPYDAGTATAAGTHPSTLLATTAGEVAGAWVMADGSGLSAPVTVDVLVAGASIGTVVIAAGQTRATPSVLTLAAPVAFAANTVATFTLVGNGTAGEVIDDIAVTYDLRV